VKARAVQSGDGPGWHERIENPINLKAKTPRVAPQTAERKLDSAQAVLATVAREFESKLAEDIDELERLFAIWAVDRSARNLAAMQGVIHDLRGEGKTFGFDLITEIGASFSRYLLERQQDRPVSEELVRQHVEAIRAIHRRDIRGEGDRLAQAVVAALHQAVDRVLDRITG